MLEAAPTNVFRRWRHAEAQPPQGKAPNGSSAGSGDGETFGGLTEIWRLPEPTPANVRNYLKVNADCLGTRRLTATSGPSDVDGALRASRGA